MLIGMGSIPQKCFSSLLGAVIRNKQKRSVLTAFLMIRIARKSVFASPVKDRE